jgi:hypothetical protein
MCELPVITFTNEEFDLFACGGAKRAVKCIRRKAAPTEGVGNDKDWQTTIEGALGEAALAKFLGLYPSAFSGYGASDCSGNEVRTSQNHNGGMRIKPEDEDDSPFWFVTGVNGVYTIRGWIYGRDAKRQEWWGVCKRPEHPVFWVPQSALRSPYELPETPTSNWEAEPHTNEDMSKEYDNTNTGRLFRNEKMRPDKQDPEYTGDANFEGEEYWVSAWINETKEKKKYFRMKFKKKTQSGTAPAPKPAPAREEVKYDADGNELPF